MKSNKSTKTELSSTKKSIIAIACIFTLVTIIFICGTKKEVPKHNHEEDEYELGEDEYVEDDTEDESEMYIPTDKDKFLTKLNTLLINSEEFNFSIEQEHLTVDDDILYKRYYSGILTKSSDENSEMHGYDIDWYRYVEDSYDENAENTNEDGEKDEISEEAVKTLMFNENDIVGDIFDENFEKEVDNDESFYYFETLETIGDKQYHKYIGITYNKAETEIKSITGTIYEVPNESDTEYSIYLMDISTTKVLDETTESTGETTPEEVEESAEEVEEPTEEISNTDDTEVEQTPVDEISTDDIIDKEEAPTKEGGNQ